MSAHTIANRINLAHTLERAARSAGRHNMAALHAATAHELKALA